MGSRASMSSLAAPGFDLGAQARIVLGREMRAMCLVRIFGIPGGLGNPLGTDGGGVRGCEHVHPAPVDVEDRAVDEGGLV
jgi:hypothetical protein